MNLADPIERLAGDRPDAPAIIAGERVISYARLDAAVNGFASALAAAGVSPGDVVGFASGLAIGQVFYLLALARLGAVSIAVPPNERPEKRKAIVEDFGVRTLIVARKEFGVPGCRSISHRDLQALREAHRAVRLPRFEGGDRPWAILFSSGTGGKPKAIVRTHAQALALAGLQYRLLEVGADDRFFCNVSLNLAASQMRVLRHLLFGSALVFPDEKTTRETFERHRVTHVFITPVVLDEWVARLSPHDRPLTGLAHFACGGGPVTEALRRQCVERLTPNLVLNYGTVETALAAIADPETQRRFPGSVGRVVPWIEAEVVAEDHRPLPPGETGFLRMRGEAVATAYHGDATDPGITEKAFRDGWFYPGDRGRMTPEGILYVEGRSDDLINLGGRKVSASEIEAVLLEHPGVAAAAVFGKMLPRGREVAVAAVITRGGFDEESLRQHCRAELGDNAPARIFSYRTFPRNAMGKVDKQALAQNVSVRQPPVE